MNTAQEPGYIPAELYDLAYSWHDDDIAFYVEQATQAGGPVLEAGCGTGRVLLPTLQAGVDIEGLDLRQAMLDQLQAKAAALGLAPTLHAADMRDFTMPHKYALITMPFRSFQHVMTTADQLKTLRCVREHLEPGGRLVLNVFFPNYSILSIKDGEVAMEREFAHPDTGLPVHYVSRTWRDRVNQTMRVESEILESDERGYIGKTHKFTFDMRWVFKPEMELLLHTAGFSHFEVQGAFDGSPLESDKAEMIWTAWRG
jgi:SAM-dependent methyltransferase